MGRTVKARVRELLAEGRYTALAELARQKRRTLGSLISLTYDTDPAVGWRAVEAMGVAAERLTDEDPDVVREHLLRRLFWLITEESGAICWRAPEAIGEIAARRPDVYGDYIPIVAHLLVEMAEEDLGHFRAGILWAIGRLGPVAGDRMVGVLPAVVTALKSPDPQVRGMAVRALAATGHRDLLAGHRELLTDDAPVELFEDGTLGQTTVGELMRRALSDGEEASTG